MGELVYTSVFKNNALIIFDALAEDELQTGVRLESDITDFSNSLNRFNYCTRYRIRSHKQLVAAFMALELECRSGVTKPVLHFECHGDTEKGLLIAASGEYVPWLELVERIAFINAATGNNTGVVLAACYGFEVSKLVKFEEPCPFHFVLGPENEVDAGYLRDSMIVFYRTVIVTGDLNQGMAHLDEKYKRFICSQWFYTSLASVMVTHFRGKNKEAFINKLIDSQVQKAGYSNRELVRGFRKRAKEYIRSPVTMFQHFSKIFMHNQPVVSYKDFRAFVDGHTPS